MSKVNLLLIAAIFCLMGCSAEERNPVDSDVPTPLGLRVTFVSPDSVSLAWDDSSDTETGYRIERSESDGRTWSIMADLPVNTTAYTDTRITEGDRLLYRLRAKEGTVVSPPTSPASVVIPLVAPTILIATTPAELQVRLDWNDRSVVNQGYEIYRHGERDDFIQIGWSASNVYVDTTIILNERFTYRVRAVKDAIFSEYGPTAQAISPFFPPANLVGTRLSSTSINLAWRDSSRVEVSYQVDRKGEGGMYRQIVSLPANSAAYSDTGLTPASIYYYRVRAITERQISTYSNEVRVVTEVLTPLPPTNLTAESTFDNPGKITLRWLDNAINEDGYFVEIFREAGRIERDDGFWEEIEQLPANSSEYESMQLEIEQVYLFRICAFNQEGVSEYSNEASALVVGIPLPPSQLTIELPDWRATILHWRQESQIEDGFRIERVDPPGVQWRLLGETGANDTTFADSTIEQLHSYFYRVAALNRAGISRFADSVGVDVPDYKPASPSGMTATARTWLAAIVSWQDNSDDEAGFQLERRQGGVDRWDPVVELRAGTTTYNDSTVTGGANYIYRIRAFNDAGVSEWAPEAAVQIPDRRVPLPPAVMIAETISSRAVTLRWIHNDNLEDGFCVQRKYSFDWEWPPDSTILPENSLTYTDSTVVSGEIYNYRVWAFNAVGNSEYSNEVTVEIPAGLPAPENLTAETVDFEKVRLTWVDPGDRETGFFLERSTNEPENFEIIALLDSNVTGYLDTSLTPDTRYYYRANCFNDLEVSGYSNVADAGTMSLLVFHDDFESYQSGEQPGNPWQVAQAGESSALITEQEAHEGDLSLEIQDRSADPASYATAKVQFQSVMKGSLECWIKLAPGGYFGIQTMSGQAGIYSFQIQFNPDGQILCRNGRGNAFTYGEGEWTSNEWMHVEVEFDVETNLYNFRLDDNLIAQNFEMQDTLLAVDKLRFIGFTGAEIEFTFIDDVTMTIVPPESVNSPMRRNRQQATGDVMQAETLQIFGRSINNYP